MKKLLLAFGLLTATIFQTKAQVQSLPYFNDFESGAPMWTTQNLNSNWELGSPSYSTTNSAHSGDNCWDINLDTNYANNTYSRLISPTFNFTGNSGIKISFWLNYNCENSWDGLTLYSTTDTGSFANWTIVGTVGYPNSINWYNDSLFQVNGTTAWTGNSNGWQYSTIVIPNSFANSDVRFAFEFYSDQSVTGAGVSMDDFSVEPSNVGFMQGTVYEDVNNNGVIDAGDTPFTNISLSCTPANGTYIQSVNSNGQFYFMGDSGVTYTITPNNPIYTLISPATQTATLTASNQVISNLDFLVTLIPGVIEVDVNASSMCVRPGFNHNQYISYSNNGTQVTSGTIQIDYDPSFTITNCSEPYNVLGPNSIEIPYSSLIPGEQRSFYCTYFVDSTLAIGVLTTSDFTIFPVSGDTIPANNYDQLNIISTNSFDPNDKRVDPVGDITPTQVTTGINLDYTINFQNTGTAEAFHVNVYDQLDTDLDLTTFEITGTSHPLTTWSMSASGFLHFGFANINLPDSNANEPASHGFISYRIKPLSTLTAGAEITNLAAIYFDNNEPVLTNEVKTTVVIPTGVYNPSNDISGLVFPNPTKGIFWFSGSSNLGTYKSYQILNLAGQLVKEAIATSQSGLMQIDASELSSGVYMLQVIGSNGVYNGNLIVE
ncbi:MAG: T9SS type A sorting domain-containing protein [Bacteroidia bacterium]|nr:T9SS type A sorting domain-containing protein [Bacteroidia bacterium]